MKTGGSDMLKDIEKVMNEDRLFIDIKMVLSTGYITAYMYMQKGEIEKAKEVKKILNNLTAQCVPPIKEAMKKIKDLYQDDHQ